MKEAKLERVAERPAGRKIDVNAWAMAGVLLAMWALLSVLPATRGMFLTEGNVTNLLSQCAVLLVVSVGMTLVILIRGIDLSVGAGVALTGVIAALLQRELGLPTPAAIGLTLLAGALIGAWHGFWVGWLGIPAFIVTLAGFKAYRGGALVASDASTIQLGDDFSFLTAPLSPLATWVIVLALLGLGLYTVFNEARRREAAGLTPLTTSTVAIRMAGQVLLAGAVLAVFGWRGVPVLVLIAGAIAVAGVFTLTRTRLGREIYAIGGNPEAARLSGIDVKRVTIIVYTVMGVLTAIAGLLAAARVSSVTASNAGNLLELDAVTAVVIGGTSIAGGRGKITGTVLGTLVFATLANGMSLLQIDSNWQLIFTGGILLLAVLSDVVLKGRKSRGLMIGLFALPVVPLVVIGLCAGGTTKANGKADVAFLLAQLREERYQKDLKYFELHAEKLGLSTATFSADDDGAKQLAQVEDALTLGAKVLVIQPTNSEAAASYVALAHARGAKVIAYDRSIVSRELDYYVSHDSYRVGVLQAEAALKHTGGKGTYVLLSGQAGHSVAAEITRGYHDTLAPYLARGDVTIALEQSHSDWSSEQALRTVENALTRSGGKVDAVLANNSGMALGAVQAIKNAGLSNVFIAGADADAANVNFVCEGVQTIEVLKDLEPLARSAAEAAAAIVRGTAPKAAATIELAGGKVPVVAVPVEVITPANAKSLIDSGFVPASKVPACVHGGAK